jgi:hypothetical protein
VHGDGGLGARADGVLKGAGIDGDGLVDVDDHGDGAGSQHRGGARHVGVGGDQHLVAGAEPDGGHRGGERVAAAGGKREVPDAEPGGVALLEALALAADAIAEQRLVADRRRDRFDLFVARDVHLFRLLGVCLRRV